MPCVACFLPALQSKQVMAPETCVNLPATHCWHASTSARLENWPAAHAVQELAPSAEPVFVIEPALHGRQRFSAFEPALPTYLPAPQSLQAGTFERIEYLPPAHFVHVVAPALVPVFVIEPAPQETQPVVELSEYLPTGHRVHVFALGLLPVSVAEPAWQSAQYDLPV